MKTPVDRPARSASNASDVSKAFSLVVIGARKRMMWPSATGEQDQPLKGAFLADLFDKFASVAVASDRTHGYEIPH
ncbi:MULTISPECIES: hypothetical protein [Rhizobium]|uniref:hypothetical protein n=1 Tax=Rhizobium TaxID=379 RepID=UPI001954DDC6|nr:MULTISPECIES: hypothetical protein [Rhizobium]